MPPEQWQDFHDEILTAPQYYVGIGLYIYKIVYASLKHLYSIWIVILGVWKFSTPVATHGHT